MAEVISHASGTFSWPELSTSDQKAGNAFYSALFGWAVNDMPMGPGDFYTMYQLRGKPVGAAATQRPDATQMGNPPHCNNCVTVATVVESEKKPGSHGRQ